MRDLYKNASAITGAPEDRTEVAFHPIMSKREKLTVWLFFLLISLSGIGLLAFISIVALLFKFDWFLITAALLVVAVEGVRLLQSYNIALFSLFAKDPIPMTPRDGLRVAVLTTMVPGKEPIEVVGLALMAMKRLRAGTNSQIDVWLLDEGNDPFIKKVCEALGVNHFSRKGIPEWNTQSGAFKARTKHGNHNAWRSVHEDNYDVVAQMDPDHIPLIDFLERTLGYFNDPDVAFVVAPQVYGNLKENWIARGAAFQAYLFHGIIQRGGNGMGAPLLIGTNHLYRTSAFKQIGGYQDSIIEDHLTSMVIYSASNPITGNQWKGVYTPDILAVGEGPTSFTDYFNQQKRWAYGIWEIAFSHSPLVLRQMKRIQALSFILLQSFYPSVAFSWVLSSFATLLFGLLIVDYDTLGPILLGLWLYSLISGLGLFYWLRKFNLVEHEKKDWGLHGMGLLLMCIPVYVSAGWQAITRKPLTYAVTAKGNLASPDTLQTFTPHINWLMFGFVSLIILIVFGQSSFTTSVFWTVEHMAICLLPITIHSYDSIHEAGRTVLSFLKTNTFGYDIAD